MGYIEKKNVKEHKKIHLKIIYEHKKTQKVHNTFQQLTKKKSTLIVKNILIYISKYTTILKS